MCDVLFFFIFIDVNSFEYFGVVKLVCIVKISCRSYYNNIRSKRVLNIDKFRIVNSSIIVFIGRSFV